jgi:hypothetical protein
LKAGKDEFPAMISGEVLIEERQVVVGISPENWRSRIYRLPGALPLRLAPEFGKTVRSDDLEVLKFARECYKERLRSASLQQPYSYFDSASGLLQTVLRTITCNMTFRESRKAGSGSARALLE